MGSLKSNAGGMLGGYVAKAMHEAERYLVISFWDSEKSIKNMLKTLYLLP